MITLRIKDLIMVEDAVEEPLYDAEERYFEEEAPQGEREKRLREKFREWSIKGDLHHVKKYINDPGVDLNDMDTNGWTPLIWAIVNNHIEIVKTVLERQFSHKPGKSFDESQNSISIANSQEDRLMISDRNKEKRVPQLDKDEQREKDFNEIFKKPLNPTSFGKYTPLHWAAYKGNCLVSSILLKHEFDPLEIDMYGNTAIHQAAASNDLNTLKLFLGLGLDIELKNARSHSPYDLCTSPQLKDIMKRTIEKQKCQICETYFDFFNKRYVCALKEEVVCRKCIKIDFFYKDHKADEREIRQCRCVNCFDEVVKHEEILAKAMKASKLSEINDAYMDILDKGIRISPKLKIKCEMEINRLERERTIKLQLESLEKVPDHKTIEKSVHMLELALQDAKEHNIKLDKSLEEKVIAERRRKLSEKELRKLLSNITVFDSSPETKLELENRISLARETGVDETYISQGENLMKNINLNLRVKEIHHNLVSYPPREYPKEEDNDPKKRKKEKPPPKKKRKKKEPPFPTPEWAKEAKDVENMVKEYKELLALGDEIGLKEDILSKTKEILARFVLEIRFRKKEEEIQRKLEEEKAKKKKKKGGK